MEKKKEQTLIEKKQEILKKSKMREILIEDHKKYLEWSKKGNGEKQ